MLLLQDKLQGGNGERHKDNREIFGVFYKREPAPHKDTGKYPPFL